MSIRSTAQDALYLLAAVAVGALLGTFVFSGWIGQADPDRDRGAISRDSSELTWDQLTSGLPPNETTVYDRSPTREECLSVPGLLVDTTRSAPTPPDTVTRTEYRQLFTAPADDAPSITFGERSGLARVGQSRYPFLYLPVTDEGEPAIDHDGQRTIVPAYSQSGRAYEFTYRYSPPAWTLFVDVQADGQWWPPIRATPRSVTIAAELTAGIEYKAWRFGIGPSFSSAAGPLVGVSVGWRPWSYSP